MSIPQITISWLLLAFAGVGLTLFSARLVYSSARMLRSFFWMSAVLFGETATVPLYFLSIAVGLVAALPICSAIFSLADNAPTIQLTLGQFFLLGVTLLFRGLFWPAIGIDWSRVRRWEQEVVRRPRGRLWAYVRAPNDSAREQLTQRAAVLGRQLTESELRNSPTFASVPKQALGLLLIFCAILGLPPDFPELQTEGRVLLISCCLWVFGAISMNTGFSKGKNRILLLLMFLFPISLWISRLLTGAWPAGLDVSVVVTHDVSRFSLLSAVFLLVSRDIAQLLELKPASAPEVGSAPIDKRYSFLKKITQTAQWLAKPSHLLALLMQLDVLLATLRITVSW